jgi:hypothetical protein
MLTLVLLWHQITIFGEKNLIFLFYNMEPVNLVMKFCQRIILMRKVYEYKEAIKRRTHFVVYCPDPTKNLVNESASYIAQ